MERVDMEIVDPKEPNESNGVNPGPGIANQNESNGVDLRIVVQPNDSGEGLPYAPVNWPNPGDNWRWKVTNRVTTHGYYVDRFLYPPKRLSGRAPRFRSKRSVEQFITDHFPHADKEAFFNSFTWKIPAINTPSLNNGDLRSEEVSEHSAATDGVRCKAGNKACNSLMIRTENHSLQTMACDICCSEPGFCQDCSCILCCKTVNTDYGGYSYIRCEAAFQGNHICGHVAHLNCALQAYMAGTVGGNIGLDAEYYCRRCDSRKDLISHVLKLLQVCKFIDSREDIEKILNVGVCILRGSKKTSAKRLLSRIEWSIIKLKCEAALEDIWNAEEDHVANFMDVADNTNEAMESTNDQDPSNGVSDLLPDLKAIHDYQDEYQRIDYEIDLVLQNLKRSQEAEFKIAQDRLCGRLRYLKTLLEQLEKERAELARRPPDTRSDALLNTVLDREEQVKREIVSLREMATIRSGFGNTSKAVLSQHFGMNVDD
ncbi:hypothetical protein ACFE04_012527 [Oxalis oulophora]